MIIYLVCDQTAECEVFLNAIIKAVSGNVAPVGIKLLLAFL